MPCSHIMSLKLIYIFLFFPFSLYCFNQRSLGRIIEPSPVKRSGETKRQLHIVFK